MKYITEYDLKTKYRNKPFQTIQVDECTRFTADAIQFLRDRRIEVITKNSADLSINVADKEHEENIPEYSEHTRFYVRLLQADTMKCALLAKEIQFNLSQQLFRLSEAIGELVVYNPEHPQHADSEETVKRYKEEAIHYKKVTPITALGKHGTVIVDLDHLRCELLLMSFNEELNTATIYQFIKEINEIIETIIQEP